MTKFIIEKSTDCKFAIGLEYSAPDLNEGEEISSVTVTASPTGLTLVGSPSIEEDKIVSQVISGGTKGTSYTVQFKVTTSVGYIYNHPDKDAIQVKIV